jgi:hypothetical protein
MAPSEHRSVNIPGHWSNLPTRPLAAIVLWVTAIMLTAVGVMQIPGLRLD